MEQIRVLSQGCQDYRLPLWAMYDEVISDRSGCDSARIGAEVSRPLLL